jgi:hypothetical protein
MADEVSEPWPSEEIPPEDDLYMRVHRRWYGPDGELDLGCFRNHPNKQSDGMSTDWSLYSTPLACQARAREAWNNGVLAMNVGEVRSIPDQTVQHTPIPENQAHTDVFGPKNSRTRLYFGRIYKIAIPLPE